MASQLPARGIYCHLCRRTLPKPTRGFQLPSCSFSRARVPFSRKYHPDGYLRFDRIGARHPGMTQEPGPLGITRSIIGPLAKENGGVLPRMSPRVVGHPADQKSNGKPKFTTHSRPTYLSADPAKGDVGLIRSKGKQQNGVVFGRIPRKTCTGVDLTSPDFQRLLWYVIDIVSKYVLISCCAVHVRS